nr:MAG TPA: hypothetical protein [Caudoviricetes sp.]
MWKTIKFNKQNIEHATEKAVLIKLPNSSFYKNYKFWHPAKLVREMSKGKGYFLTLSYTDEFRFKIFKKDKATKIICGEELAMCFNQLTEADETTYLEVVEPIKIDKEVEVIKELKR